MGQLCVDTDYHGGIVGGDVVIERETNGAFERLATMVGGISCGLLVEVAVREWTPLSWL